MQLGEASQIGNCLATNLFLPQWWVQAYENALRAQHERLVYAHFRQGGTLPLSSPFEVYILSFLLSQLQSSILESGIGKGIVLDPLLIERQVGAKLFQSTQSIKRVALALGGLRLMNFDSDRTHAIALFTDQAIERKGDSFVMHLQPNSNYIESFFGYIDAYRELSRSIQAKPTLQKLCSERPPLLVWKSIWLDMKGVEQALFLRLERAMQWQYRMVHVDGVYSESLRDLFSSLKPGPNGHRLSHQIITLKRLSKKLIDHGVLSFNVPKEYLAYGQEENGAQYLWRISRRRAFSPDVNQYCQMLYKAWQRIFTPQYTADFLTSVACGMELGQHERKIKRLLDILESEEQTSTYDKCMPLAGNLLLSLKHLYLEWLIRSLKGHPHPLPDKIKETKIFPLVCQLEDPEEVVRSLYSQYLRELQNDLSYWEMLENCPLASLVTKSTWQEKSFLQSFKTKKGQASTATGQVITRPSPSQPSLQSIKPIELKKTASDEKQNLQGSSLRQMADVELERLLQLKNDDYAGLTQAYIKSLDPRSQKMFLDIRKQMQPKMFDQHVKERLLQFMIENPEKWQSTPEVH